VPGAADFNLSSALELKKDLQPLLFVIN